MYHYPAAHQVPSATNPVAAVAAAAQQWQEYTTQEGKKYYFNKITQVTQWNKPQELIDMEKHMQMMSPWSEHMDQNGKKYYYNAMTGVSTWDMPQEYRDFINRQQQQQQQIPLQQPTTIAPNTTTIMKPLTTTPTTAAATIPVSSSSSPPKVNKAFQKSTPAKSKGTSPIPPTASAVTTLEPKRSDHNNKQQEVVKEAPSASAPKIVELPAVNTTTIQRPKSPEYKTREEAVKAFKQLLEDAGVSVYGDWPTAMKKIINDRRYKALKKVSEKQAVFHEFVEEKKRHEREEQYERKRKQRQDFIQMLSDLVPDLNSRTHYRSILSNIQNDPRFIAVDHEQDRLDFFDDYMHELQKKERKENELKRKEYMDQLKTVLQQKVDEGIVTYKSSSRKMDEILHEEECYQKLQKNDRLMVWDDLMLELQRKEDEKRALERLNRKKREKDERAAFRELLVKLNKQDRKMNVLSRWKEVKPFIVDEPAFKNIMQSGAARPKDLFNDFLDELELEYKANKKTLRAILKDLNYSVDLNTPMEQFTEVLSRDERTKSLDPENLKILFEESIDRAKQREKRKRKYAARFFSMLDSLGVVRVDSTLDQIRPLVQDQRAWLKLKTDEERTELLNEYIRNRLIAAPDASITTATTETEKTPLVPEADGSINGGESKKRQRQDNDDDEVSVSASEEPDSKRIKLEDHQEATAALSTDSDNKASEAVVGENDSGNAATANNDAAQQ